MKSTMNVIAAVFVLSLVSSGCYTQLATRDASRDGNDDETYASSDTSAPAVSNEYFADDAYRHSRFDLSFSYYHPGRWGYYNGIYDPWFDDPWYWPMGWRPYVLYPYPTWYPYDSYYGNHHYWGYYNGPNYGGGPSGSGGGREPFRRRLTGSTRGEESRGLRSPFVNPGGGVSKTGGAPAGGTRMRDQAAETQQQTQGQAERTPGRRTRGNETPWWERTKQQTSTSGTQTSQQPSGNGERRQRQVEQAPNTAPATTQSTAPAATERPKGERRERKEQRTQSASPQSQPQQRPSAPANRGGGGGGRERSGVSSSGGSQSSGSSSGGSSSGTSSSGRQSSGGGTRQRER